MRVRARVACCVLALAAVGGRLAHAQDPDRQLRRLEEALRREGDAVVAVADQREDRAAGLTLTWRNDFLKAQTGTFVPFVIEVEASERRPPAALLYLRLARRAGRGDIDAGRTRGREPRADESVHPFEEIYPVDLVPGDGALRIIRGFSVAPGEYDLTVVVRERERDTPRGRRPLAGVLRQPLDVPDYAGPALTTSTIILADTVTPLDGGIAPDELPSRPYVIGGREIRPARDARLQPNEELIVVFLIYNPAITLDKHFELQVEYHFFRNTGQGATGAPRAAGLPAARPGEAYFNRTEPQRFNPRLLGRSFDPSAGQPVLAGQGVPLGAFAQGEYRLVITVRDLVSGRSIERQVTFTVGS